jgi:hypothetical protein
LNNNNNNNKEERRGERTGTNRSGILNIAEYLNTNYIGDRFANIVKNHEGTKPDMNSITKLAATITEDLSQLNGENDTKQYAIKHTKAKLGEVLKKNWKTKQCMGNTSGM